MSITVYKTDAIIITDHKSMAELVEWASGDMVSGLVGKKVIVVESSFSWTEKSPTRHEKSVLTLFHYLLAQSRKLSLDFTFILNHPEYLDPRIKAHIGEIKTLG